MKFDILVVTASNEAQARGYRAMVAPLVGSLAEKILVVPDPGGKRVGSLGSTVGVLRKLGDVSKRRVLICHSGGDSKRLPSYAAIGKAFVPVPDSRGKTVSLFERIVANMEQLRLPKSGVLVVCGDVAPEFDFGSCDFSKSGVTGVAYYDSPEEGSRHGVYVPGNGERVRAFLQKPSPSAAKAAGAVCRGKVAVDTGILWIDPATAKKIVIAGWKVGDIYDEFARELLNGFAPFHVNVVPRCSFFHIGSTRELLARLGKGREWVEGCAISRDEMKLGGRNVVTFVPREFGPIDLAEGECLTCLPVGGKWIPIRYRVEDDFKSDGKWDKLKLGEIMKKVDHKKLLALRKTEDCITVELPLRIDFAGGWSDTPPICYKMGGAVFNAAVTLNGVKPVKVRVRRLAEKEVHVESVDLGKSGVLKSLAEIRAPKDPHDWCALVKSALTVTKFDFSCGGLDIRISADVPKGSGMGTSSILGAALVTALERVAGRKAEWKRVASLTLALEKEMATGGGWQDQIGGLVPGAHLISTTPGKGQNPRMSCVSPKSEAAFAKFLKERALLYFTGRKRMARNILRGVIGFFEENPDDIARSIVRRLKSDAERAFRAVESCDWDSFCSAVNDYWLSKKALDPGSTNPLVELIIARMAPWISAVSLCGAGGGGFMFVVARSKDAKAKIKSVLEKHPPIKTGRFFDFEIAKE
ncbi:MAG: hypothetical protein IJG18_05040 [Kiritimatiellae bacterium]|nr:hypothetical protein [Kiritimatiellia bacterium]